LGGEVTAIKTYYLLWMSDGEMVDLSMMTWLCTLELWFSIWQGCRVGHAQIPR